MIRGDDPSPYREVEGAMPPENVYDIRAAREDDLPACVGLFLAVFNGPPWNESWEREAASRRLGDCFGTPGFQGWVAEDADGTVGALTLGYREPYNREVHYFLKEMCVHPAWQRRGVGRATLRRLVGDLNSAGVHRVYLLTARDGEAETFYRHCGFYVSPRMVMMARRLTE